MFRQAYKMMMTRFCTLLTFLVGAAAQATFELTLLHVNDHHSHLEAETFDIPLEELPAGLNLPNGTGDVVSVTYGGFPNLVTLFDLLVASETNPFKVHAGDMVTGTLYYTATDGAADAAMMNQVCFEAVALGNHEFDSGDKVLADFIGDLQASSSTICPPTPILSANVEPAAGTPLAGLVEKYLIAEISGEQVAFIGATTADTTITSSPDVTTNFTNVVTAVTAVVEEVTALNVTKIVVLSHVGFNDDLNELALIAGVDIVVGGHSHSLLGEDVEVGLLKVPDAAYPSLVIGPDGGSVCVVQAWEYGHGLGVLNVEFDEAGAVVSCDGGPKFPFDSSPTAFSPELDAASAATLTTYLEQRAFVAVTPDAEAQAELDMYTQQVEESGSEVIADVPEPGICYERIPGQGRSQICTPEETLPQGGGVCNLVAQAFLDQALSSDVAIQNGGGCRTDIFQGNFTVGNAVELLPFSNTLVTLEMTGAQIITVLNQACDAAATDVSTGAYPYAAGLRYNVDFSAAPDYVSNVEVNARLAEAAWMPLDESAVYTVVTNDFISTGRDNYLEFAEVDPELVTNLYLEYSATFIKYAKSVGSLVDPPRETYSTKSFVDADGGTITDPTEAPVTSEEATSAPSEKPVDTSNANGIGPCITFVIASVMSLVALF